MTTSADRVEGQCAYLLHSRPYRESSALVDLITPDFGRVRAVLRGVRQPRSRKRELLRSFQPLTLSWQGRGELKTIRDGEGQGLGHPLQGRALWCGLYLNELLVRLLPADTPHPRLFALYRFSLEQLADPEAEQTVLRMFEKRLLEELGFGICFETCANGEAIDPLRHYRFDPQLGFCAEAVHAGPPQLISGAAIRAIAADDYGCDAHRRAAKWLMRQALAEQLGSRPLISRALFQTPLAVTAPPPPPQPGGHDA
ncbi:MAG TPA: DNA repair protein RecO [Motiliproteus sp.]